MNAQTPAKRLHVVKHPSRSDCLSITDGLNHLGECASYEAIATPERLSQIKSDAILFAASYTAFDKAGRELGVDAAELARAVDLAALIRCANALRLDPKADPFARACAQTLWDKLPH